MRICVFGAGADASGAMEIEAQLMAPLALARAAGVPIPTLDVLVSPAAGKAAAKGLYQP